MQERKQIVLLLIATNAYKQYVQPLLDGVKKFFLVNHDITVELFTDEIRTYEGDERVKINQTLIVSLKFPEATMLRYKIFASKSYDCDYLFYSDIDMAFVDFVSDEILGEVVAVRHPGFYNGGGSWETNEKSMCFTPEENRIKYFAGGFNGGSLKNWGRAMEFMKNIIDADLKNGVTPIWHDESALNFFLSFNKPTVELSPSYCMVQNMASRKSWGIDHFEPRIVALDKDHQKIRE